MKLFKLSDEELNNMDKQRDELIELASSLSEIFNKMNNK